MKQLLFEQLNKINENQACVFSGHRHLGEDFSLKSLKKEIERLIKEKKVNTFYCGMAMGFDLYAGEIVAKLKKKFPVKLIACIPYYGQEKGYLETDKKRYFKLLKACDEQVLLSDHYYKGCPLKRNKYMVDNAQFLICYLREQKGGTFYTVNYFKKKYGEENIVYM